MSPLTHSFTHWPGRVSCPLFLTFVGPQVSFRQYFEQVWTDSDLLFIFIRHEATVFIKWMCTRLILLFYGRGPHTELHLQSNILIQPASLTNKPWRNLFKWLAQHWEHFIDKQAGHVFKENNVHTVRTRFFRASLGLFPVETLQTEFARPRALGRFLDGWNETVHMVTTIAIVAEQKLIIVLWGSTQGATFALDALPRVFLHGHQHVGWELEASRVTWQEIRARNPRLIGPRVPNPKPRNSHFVVPDLPHSAQETSSSGCVVFLFSVASPRQKSQ